MKPLSFLRIIDESGQLSITNISILGLLIKILSEPHPQAADCIALFVAVANYLGKRIVQYHQAKIQKPSYDLEKMNAELQALRSDIDTQKHKISSLSMAAGVRPPMRPLGS